MKSIGGSIKSRLSDIFGAARNRDRVEGRSGQASLRGHVDSSRNAADHDHPPRGLNALDRLGRASGTGSVFGLGGTRGLRVLCTPENVDVDIVFIHGLIGDSYRTWSHKSGVFWPVDLLPSDVPSARIMTFGYDADVARILGQVGGGTLRTHAATLVAELGSLRRVHHEATRPIIVVAHSLGGLLLEKAVCISAESVEAEHVQLSQCLIGICFMGTPHRGSTMADFASVVSGVLRLAQRSVNKPILNVLRPNSEVLTDVRESFALWLRRNNHRVSLTCFFEEYEMAGVGIVVDERSATIDGYLPLPIPASHRDMPKFPHRDDLGYRRIIGRISTWLSNLRTGSAMNDPEDMDNSDSSEDPVSDAQLSAPEGQAVSSEYQKFLDLLFFPEMDTRQSTLSRPANDTCLWLVDHPTYRIWQDPGRSIIWLLGHPGTGKTTLMMHALQHARLQNIEKSQELQISFFFYNLGTELQRTPEGLLRALIYQILAPYPRMFDALVDDFFKRRRTNPRGPRQWYRTELLEILEAAISVLLRTVGLRIFVDAVDECRSDTDEDDDTEDAKYIVKQFRELTGNFRSSKYPLSLCLSSRHYPCVSPPNTELRITVEEENQNDIQEYLFQELSDRIPPKDKNFKKKLQNEISAHAQGSFQWTRLVTSQALRTYERGHSHRRVLEVVKSLPSDLSQLYDNMMSSLLDTERDWSFRLFQWVCFSARPLTIRELRAALSQNQISLSDLSNASIDANFSRQKIETDEQMERLLPFLSKGLVEIKQRSSVANSVDSRGRPRSIASRSSSSSFGNNRTVSVASLPAISEARFPDDSLGDSKRIYLIHQSVKDYLIRRGFSLFDATLNTAVLSVAKGNEALFLSYVVTCAMSVVSHFMGDGLGLRQVLLSEGSGQEARGFTLRLTTHEIRQLWDIALSESSARDFNAMGMDDDSLLRWFHHTSATLDQPGISEPRGWDKSWWMTPRERLRLAFEIRTVISLTRVLKINPLGLKCHWVWIDHLRDSGLNRQTLQSTAYHTVSLMDRYGSLIDPLHQAATIADSAVVSGMLSYTPCRQNWLNSRDIDQDTPLMVAAGYGHEAVASRLLQEPGIDVNACNINRRTALHIAASQGHALIIRLLMQDGADIHARDDNCDTALILAAHAGHIEAVKVLTLAGARLHDADQFGKTSLSSACFNGHYEVVDHLLKCGANPAVRDFSGRSPLYHALLGGQKRTYNLLFKHGCSVDDLSDEERERVMYRASKQGNPEVVRLLFSTSWKHPVWQEQYTAFPREFPNANDEFFSTPLGAAMVNDSDDALRVLCAHGALPRRWASGAVLNYTVDWDGGMRASVKCIKVLAQEFQQNISIQEKSGDTLLHKAISRVSNPETLDQLVQTLLDCGINANVEDSDGRTALMLAIRERPSVCSTLIKSAMVDVNAQTWRGTALLVALETTGGLSVFKGPSGAWKMKIETKPPHQGLIQLLLGHHNILVGLGFKSGWTPLHAAVSGSLSAEARLLLSRDGSLANRTAIGGVTPLSLAARGGNIDLLKAMLDGPASVNLADSQGRTPLSHAAQATGLVHSMRSSAVINPPAYEDVVRLLCSQPGVDVNKADINGSTPLDWALESLIGRQRAFTRRESQGHASEENSQPEDRETQRNRLTEELEVRMRIVDNLRTHGGKLTPGIVDK